MKEVNAKTEIISKAVEMIDKKTDDIMKVTRENLDEIFSTRKALLHAVFEASEVDVPTSFIILPFDIRKTNDKREAKALDGMFDQLIAMKNKVKNAVSGCIKPFHGR